jgi:hypothetical protein
MLDHYAFMHILYIRRELILLTLPNTVPPIRFYFEILSL